MEIDNNSSTTLRQTPVDARAGLIWLALTTAFTVGPRAFAQPATPTRTTTIRVAAPVHVTGTPLTAASSGASSGVININTASPEELQILPGIGESKARAIIDARARLGGRFRRVEDFLRVRGVGRATFRRLRPFLVVDGTSTLRQTPTVARGDQNDEDSE